MALMYFYDATELDTVQLTAGLKNTDHHWQYITDTVSIDTINPDTEVLSVFITSKVTAKIIDSLPKLRLIACRSTGFNNIDLEAAKARGVSVVNVPTYGESTVAEYAFTLLLALTRKLPQTLKNFDSEVSTESLMGNDLHEKTLGVIGTGRIGQHVIKIAHGFGMRILAYDPYPIDELGKELQFEYVSLAELLLSSDMVTIHAPFVGSNNHMLNADNMRTMKKSALIVNTARGELIDTKALIEALEEKRIAGAALDVIEGEQLMHVDEEMALLRSENASFELLEHSVELLALYKMPNVILTPHNAFNTVEAIGRINSVTVDNIIRFWYGEIDNQVEPVTKSRGKLLLVRHAESEWNATGKWTGITDVHLSEKGFHEAGLYGIGLREMNITVDKAYCSQQIRSLETLEGILDASQQLDVPIERSAAINERDYGDYTGKNKWEMKEALGDDEFNKVRRGWDAPIPGGETLEMVYARALPFYSETVVPLLNKGDNVLLVAHGNSIRALMKYIESLDESQVESLEMLFGNIVAYDVDEQGKSLQRKDTQIEIAAPNA